jgi:hypothetical protein
MLPPLLVAGSGTSKHPRSKHLGISVPGNTFCYIGNTFCYAIQSEMRNNASARKSMKDSLSTVSASSRAHSAIRTPNSASRPSVPSAQSVVSPPGPISRISPPQISQRSSPVGQLNRGGLGKPISRLEPPGRNRPRVLDPFRFCWPALQPQSIPNISWLNSPHRSSFRVFCGLSLLGGLVCGCQVLTYTSPTGERFTRSSLGANTSIHSLSVESSTNGVRKVHLNGYQQDQTQALGAVTDAAVRAAIQAAKP